MTAGLRNNEVQKEQEKGMSRGKRMGLAMCPIPREDGNM